MLMLGFRKSIYPSCSKALCIAIDADILSHDILYAFYYGGYVGHFFYLLFLKDLKDNNSFRRYSASCQLWYFVVLNVLYFLSLLRCSILTFVILSLRPPSFIKAASNDFIWLLSK